MPWIRETRHVYGSPADNIMLMMMTVIVMMMLKAMTVRMTLMLMRMMMLNTRGSHWKDLNGIDRLGRRLDDVPSTSAVVKDYYH